MPAVAAVLGLAGPAVAEAPVSGPVATDRGRDVWMARAPLEPALWPDAGHPVNRDRVYDFYAKQADFFATQPDVLQLILPEYPGLDSGAYGQASPRAPKRANPVQSPRSRHTPEEQSCCG